jgi:adenylosuccinate synthase
MKNFSKQLGQVCVVLGGQWGDEGKGKLVDILAHDYDIVARATGGANAGHTIYVGDKKFVFHLVPAGMLHPKKLCVMGNGMVVHLPTLLEELDVLAAAKIQTKGRLMLSDRAHLTFDYHKVIDGLQEQMKGSSKVGTTGRGIGPTYADKISRIGIRAGELLNFEQFEIHYRQNLELFKKMYDLKFDGEAELRMLKGILPRIKPLIADTNVFTADVLKKKKTILVEGANGTLLDIDHGTYPYVTSSNASIGGVITGAGIAPKHLHSSIGIMKAYCTRVGAGPFPTELKDDLGEKIRTIGGEFGATTGRPRRCGWFDAVASKYSVQINGFSGINLTKVDVLNEIPKLKIAVAYKYNGKKLAGFPSDLSLLEKCTVDYITMPGWMCDISKAKTFASLPAKCKAYILKLEKLLECPIKFIGTGQRRDEMLYR